MLFAMAKKVGVCLCDGRGLVLVDISLGLRSTKTQTQWNRVVSRGTVFMNSNDGQVKINIKDHTDLKGEGRATDTKAPNYLGFAVVYKINQRW